MATISGVSQDSLQDFNVTCASIVVAFKLVVSSGSQTTVDSMLRKIHNVVSNGTMKITIDNQVVLGNKQSFSSYIDPAYKKPVPVVDDGLSTGAIVGIVIGVVAFIVILIIILYFYCIKKSTRKQNTVEPDDNGLELKGKTSFWSHFSQNVISRYNERVSYKIG